MNWYLDPITKKYADFSGRASRQEYWMFFLASLIVGSVVGVLCVLIGTVLRAPALMPILVVLYSLAVFLPGFALTVRRLHDTGRSGWWLLIAFIPFGSLVLLLFYVMDSQPGDNQYGPNPKGVQAAVAPSM